MRVSELNPNELNQHKREAIVATARACIGTPFRLQGTDPLTGLDCRGLLLYCYAQRGWIPLQPGITRDRKYRLGDVEKLLRVLQAECDAATLEAAQIGDIVLLRDSPERAATHCGILTGVPTLSEPRFQNSHFENSHFYICHASYPHRRVVEHHIPRSEMWRIESVWRVKGFV